MPVVHIVDKDGEQKVVSINRLGNGLKSTATSKYATISNANFQLSNLKFQPTDAFSVAISCHVPATVVDQSALYDNSVTSTNQDKGGLRLYFRTASNGFRFSMYGTGTTNLRAEKNFNNLWEAGLNTFVFTKAASVSASGLKAYNKNGEVIGSVLSDTLPATAIDWSTNYAEFFRLTSSVTAVFQGIIYRMQFFNKELSILETTQLIKSDCANIYGIAGNLLHDFDFEYKSGLVITCKKTGLVVDLSAGYVAGDTSLGAGNHWVDNQQQPITE